MDKGKLDTGVGSVFEQAVRYVLLLNISGEKMTADRICNLDFIITYAADFGLDEYNLHGESFYRFSEYASRKTTAKKALLQMVMKDLISVEPDSERGMLYSVTAAGEQFCDSFSDEYSEEYTDLADRISFRFREISDRELDSIINRRISNSIEVIDNAGV